MHRLLLAGVVALGCSAAQAQYKVVGPDGRITYTDRPVITEAGAQVQSLRRDSTVKAASGPAQPAAANPALPAELRPLVARFPVILYTSSDCAPCALGRSLLLQRGVPFNERTISSDDDIAALARLTGGRSVPAITVGGQALRGFQDLDWHGTLDLAGYPRESKLPRNYQPPPAAPAVARSTAEPITITVAPAGPAPEAALPAPAASAGIRF